MTETLNILRDKHYSNTFANSVDKKLRTALAGDTDMNALT